MIEKDKNNLNQDSLNKEDQDVDVSENSIEFLPEKNSNTDEEFSFEGRVLADDIIEAVKNNDLEEVKSLIARGVSVNTKENSDETILMIAKPIAFLIKL